MTYYGKLNIPPSMSEGLGKIRATWAGDFAEDPALTSTARAEVEARRIWLSIDAIRNAKKPTDTTALHIKRVKDSAHLASKKILNLLDTADSQVKARSEWVHAEIEKRIGLKDSTPQDAEIRQVLRGMTHEQRGQALTTAIERGDKYIVAAAIRGGELLTGLPPELVSRYREKAEEKWAGELLGFRKALVHAGKSLENLMLDSLRLEEEAPGSTEVQKKLEQEAARADAALQEFAEIGRETYDGNEE
jgi:hypothetical protein